MVSKGLMVMIVMAVMTMVTMATTVKTKTKHSLLKKYNSIYGNMTYGELNNLPITYYTRDQVTAEVDLPHSLLELHQCDASAAGTQYVVISVITPDNPHLDLDLPFPVVEISVVENVFNASTVIGCNYVRDSYTGLITSVYNNITYRYPGGNQILYFRFRSYTRAIPVTFQVSYTDYATTQIGQFDPVTFQNIQIEDSNYVGQFSQFFKLSSTGSVLTNSYTSYYAAFCGYQPPCQNENYQATITVTALPSSPLSAMNLVICSKNEVQDYQNCKTINEFALVDDCACAVATLTLSNQEYSIYGGVYINVQGEGSPPDDLNLYVLTITLN